ncbi:DUF1016 N-terminal domain-containing protein [Cognataquiflexum rubidum]|uniref:DUF1016 N-terminal domain-containing protein n=1 Tax=Cognataquiflexum rubidum TaxID=2922273 RepID=UPI001F13C7D9|nr:DUF1016 N-terminal domain-containing protein [Cognataquiflexum rubidum]MCH6234708.1 DUF1016 N-terminal domain-containing protein [Cognataquiflexum rubidum]
MDKEYKAFLLLIKEQISTAQVRTAIAANREMLFLYWKLGQLILVHQSNKGWGAKVIDLLSSDLKKELPLQKGFSVRNLKYMRKFALEYSIPAIEKLNEASDKLRSFEHAQSKVQNIISDFVQQAVAQIESTIDEDDKSMPLGLCF